MTVDDTRWGVKWQADGSVEFRLWAPSQPAVSLELGGKRRPMHKADGWFKISFDGAESGAPYGFVLADGRFVPDPASRQQAATLAGPSILVPATPFPWVNTGWRGRPWHESVIYEIHVGTFTQEGTFAAAAARLGALAGIGITAIEIMPVAQFPGDRGWGYDGVLQYAPHPAYGTPDDLKALIDAAHGHGLMVLLDVVYNHFGSQDSYLSTYAPEFFQQDKSTPWGQSIAFERQPVRRYFLDNMVYWIDEFHFDGLRLDAVDQIEDNSPAHFLEDAALIIRKRFSDRHVHLVVENPANTADLVVRRNGIPLLYDADWNDDFHHAMHVAATGEGVGHYAKFAETPWHDVARTLAKGPVHAGEPLLSSPYRPSEEWHPSAYVHFLQNHDQVGNRAFGERLWQMIAERQAELWMAVLLLSPQVPLMFMGDHFHASKPFHFFAEYEGEIAEAIRNARPGEARNFGGIDCGRSEADIPDPLSVETFEACKLDWSEATTPRGQRWSELTAALLRIRREYLQPHLACGCAALALPAPAEQLYVDWQFPHGLLELRANFSTQPSDEIALKGGIIHSSGTYARGHLGAESLVVAYSKA